MRFCFHTDTHATTKVTPALSVFKKVCRTRFDYLQPERHCSHSTESSNGTMDKCEAPVIPNWGLGSCWKLCSWLSGHLRQLQNQVLCRPQRKPTVISYGGDMLINSFVLQAQMKTHSFQRHRFIKSNIHPQRSLRSNFQKWTGHFEICSGSLCLATTPISTLIHTSPKDTATELAIGRHSCRS